MSKNRILKDVTISGLADKGMSVGRSPEGEVIFIEGAVPGDVMDVKRIRKRKGVWRGIPERITHFSEHRVDPPCIHFRDCGGCKWQHFDYQAQISHKEQVVRDAMYRLAKINVYDFRPIMGADKIFL